MKTEYRVNLGNEELGNYWNTNNPKLETVETNQATEILVDRFLGTIPVDQILETIKIWASKLRLGGRLIINELDLIQVSKAVLTKSKTVPEINRILYEPGRNSCLTLDDLSDIIRQLGLKIVRKSLVDFEYSLIAERV